MTGTPEDNIPPRYDLAIKWGPAWTDQPAGEANNYDHFTRESLTLSEALEAIRAFPSRILQITLELEDQS